MSRARWTSLTVEALKTKFPQAGKDMCTILEWANTQDVAIKDAGSIRLAQRVFDENYERDEQGEYQQTCTAHRAV